ncbi:cation-translocating P-type ATPase [Methanothermobacter tenebrarum]|uniref:Cadmium-translocating P-type ATPase n=1 Tax=Methanothermobacter tenebrarum TaxID=680118 RepID=A0A328PCR4_9EURY|nr:cation-translocating P-type ATPase [Methanothermobacter tenebrarum]MBC7100993.1 cadmium-translocating P-type ATPase [Methanobacteriales archaeon]MBC7117433.1 cadmium-translocating P-type ATPase [Methanobacteriaceae archaeon]NPV64689.1 cadmium-translocating P-type ATPase [Methanobacteriaceae archaeon]RAO79023.1 cadmium-translocating P-type ATPase [Methanothermobacter tenebrarum]
MPCNNGKDKKTILISAILFIIGFYLQYSGYMLPAFILFTLTVLVSGLETFKGAILALYHGKFTINLLITLAVIGAYSLGDYPEAAIIVFLYYIAEYLEEYATGQAHESIKGLMQLKPEIATIKIGKKEVKVDASRVQPGEIMVIRPGDMIPLDGRIIDGSSYVDQSNITGESEPVHMTVGDEVLAGTINLGGYLEVKVTRNSERTIIARVIELIEKARMRRSSREVFMEKFASYYTPTIIIASILTGIIPSLIIGNPETWIYRALVLMVIACPCALVISVPVAMISGITAATRKGILIKGSSHLEEMSKIKTIVFDKTGTLTQGELTVKEIKAYNNANILKIAASLEKGLKHPIAEAITKLADEKGLEPLKVEDLEYKPGYGISGRIDGKLYFLGQNTRQKTENTSILLESDGKIIGEITLEDKMRPSAPTLIQRLSQENIKAMILTGDNPKVAEKLARKLKIDKYIGGLLPEDKFDFIENLKSKGRVAMVGDGINDAPALVAADVGIAMGTRGSDIALDTADIVLIDDDLMKIHQIIELGRRTMRIVKENIFFSILVKGSLALLSIFGLVSLWMAVGIGDMGLSLAVILNGLRNNQKILSPQLR